MKSFIAITCLLTAAYACSPTPPVRGTYNICFGSSLSLERKSKNEIKTFNMIFKLQNLLRSYDFTNIFFKDFKTHCHTSHTLLIVLIHPLYT